MATLPLPSAMHVLPAPRGPPQAVAVPRDPDDEVGKNWSHMGAPGIGLPPLSLAVTVRLTVVPLASDPRAAIGTGGWKANEATGVTALAWNGPPASEAMATSALRRIRSGRLKILGTRMS